MTKQLFGEVVMIAAGVLFFVGIAATIGIPGDERKAASVVAAEESAPVRGPVDPPFRDIPAPFSRGWER